MTAGNLIVLGVSCYGYDISSVTDSLGNTYTLIDNVRDTPNDSPGATYYAKNITGGACTITVSMTGSNYYQRVIAVEYSGLDTTAPLDVHTAVNDTTVSTTTDSASSGSTGTTSAADSLVFGYIGPTQAGSITAGTGFTSIANEQGCLAEESNAASTGTYEATGTGDMTTRVVAFVAVFKPAAGGGGGGGGTPSAPPQIRQLFHRSYRPRPYAPGRGR